MADSKGATPSKPTKRSRGAAKRTKTAAKDAGTVKDEKAATAKPSSPAAEAPVGAAPQMEALHRRLEQIYLSYVATIQEGQNRLRLDQEKAAGELLSELGKRYESIASEQNEAYNTYLQTLGKLATEDHSEGQLAESVNQYYAAMQELTGTHPDQRGAVEKLYQDFLRDVQVASGSGATKEAIDEVYRDFVNRIDQQLRNTDAHARATEATRSYLDALQSHNAKVQEGAARALEAYSNAVAASWGDEKAGSRLSKGSDRFEAATESAWKELRDLHRGAADEATRAVTAALEEHRHSVSN